MEDGGVIPIRLHTDLLAGGGSRGRSSAGLEGETHFPRHISSQSFPNGLASASPILL